jgi:hypothetical protein
LFHAVAACAGKRGFVLLEALHDPASAGFDVLAEFLDVGAAGPAAFFGRLRCSGAEKSAGENGERNDGKFHGMSPLESE